VDPADESWREHESEEAEPMKRKGLRTGDKTPKNVELSNTTFAFELRACEETEGEAGGRSRRVLSPWQQRQPGSGEEAACGRRKCGALSVFGSVPSVQLGIFGSKNRKDSQLEIETINSCLRCLLRE